MIGIVVAVLVGAGIAVQVAVLGRAAGRWDPLAVSLALQMAGVLGGAVWATSTGSWSETLAALRNWWWIPLGVGGWVVVAGLGVAAGRIGSAATLGFAVAAQLSVAVAIDAAGGAGIGLPRLAGVVMVGSGAVLLGMST